MVFKANEAVGNFKHFGLKCARILLARQRSFYLARYRNLGVPVTRARRLDGQDWHCHACGYDMISVNLDNDWTLETCSAMPVLLLNSPLFAAWKKGVPAQKLPTTHV